MVGLKWVGVMVVWFEVERYFFVKTCGKLFF